jgi:hypothetical protein
MTNSRASRIGMYVGLIGGLGGAGIGILPLVLSLLPVAPKEPLVVRLDTAGPYVILATTRASRDFAQAIDRAKTLHPKAVQVEFEPGDLAGIAARLKQIQPRYALVFIEPDELDVNFAWRWLETTCRLDDDPFVDVRTGFITGAAPESVNSFMARIATAAQGRLELPGALVDDLGPPEVGDQNYFNTLARSDFVPALGARFGLRSVFHGKGCFTDNRLDSLDQAGVVHFGGHGHPNQIDDGLTAAQLPRLKLAACVVFNGACYTGVTGRWYDQTKGQIVESRVAPDESFCLKMLDKSVIAYLAALHPDHGMPVYQEIEYLAYHGGPLGDVIKNTYDGVVMGSGGKMPEFERLADGLKAPKWRPADVMLKGTAARVLFGDPALIPCDAFTPVPFATTVEQNGDALRVKATLVNPALKSTFTDTYFNDLNLAAPFNDRALFVVDLPEGWDTCGTVESVIVTAGGGKLPHRVVGQAVEIDQGKRRLHVQVDVPATGFQLSAFRVAGATVEMAVRK